MKTYLWLRLPISLIGLLAASIIIQRFFPPQSIVVLIDKSFCPDENWQVLVREYSKLYRQHQQKHINIDSVVVVNSLAKEVIHPLPSPEAIAELSPFGTADPQLKQQFSMTSTKILSCNQ